MNYPWYSLLKNDEELSQGDIIKNCPIPRLLTDAVKDISMGEQYKTEIIFKDGVVVTQACDIANHKVENIILCSVIPLTDYKSSSGKGREKLRSDIMSIVTGRQPGYHLLNEYVGSDYNEDFLLVSFKDSFSVPIELLKQVAKGNEYRLRLNPPYREHLSQAYARFFMRVGLPEDIDRSKL